MTGVSGVRADSRSQSALRAQPHGFLNVCKPRDFTSHDVVAVTRRLLGTRRIGHAGTLDPAAEGVLPLCIGRATRLAERVSGADKGYYAEIVVGMRTQTDDAEGDVIDTVPGPVIGRDALEAALERQRGPLLQRPPAFSAIKVAGRRAYQLARRGDDVQLQPRPVTIHRLTLHRWEPPRLVLTIACSKGTYVRAIARDLGEALGCGAHLARLVRLWVGDFRLADAVSLDEIDEAARSGRLGSVLAPPDRALGGLPAAIVRAERSADLEQGRAWPLGPSDAADGTLARIYDPSGALLGLASVDRGRRVWQPKLAFNG